MNKRIQKKQAQRLAARALQDPEFTFWTDYPASTAHPSPVDNRYATVDVSRGRPVPVTLISWDGNKHVTVMNAAGCVSDFKDGYLYLRPTPSHRWRVPRSVLAAYEDRTPPLFQWYDLLSRGSHEEIRNALPTMVGSPLFMGTADLLSKLISL